MVVEDEGDVLDIMVQLLTLIFHGATDVSTLVTLSTTKYGICRIARE